MLFERHKCHSSKKVTAQAVRELSAMAVVKVSNAIKEYRSKVDATTVLKDFSMNVAAKTM